MGTILNLDYRYRYLGCVAHTYAPALATSEAAHASACASAAGGAPAARGMGHRPMGAKRNRPEGYPMDLTKAPACLGFGVEQGAGISVDSVAEKPEGRSAAARVLANGVQGWSALGVGPSLHSPAPVCIAPASSLNAGTLFFIARNEGSSMAPDNYACIHRMK